MVRRQIERKRSENVLTASFRFANQISRRRCTWPPLCRVARSAPNSRRAWSTGPIRITTVRLTGLLPFSEEAV